MLFVIPIDSRFPDFDGPPAPGARTETQLQASSEAMPVFYPMNKYNVEKRL
jgi:hypothetical protein